MTRITDMRDDPQPESSGWLFKSPIARGGTFRGDPTKGRTACLPTAIIMSTSYTFTLRAKLRSVLQSPLSVCVFVCLWVRLITASAQCLRRL